jgi:hypothetical protein
MGSAVESTMAVELDDKGCTKSPKGYQYKKHKMIKKVQ